MNTSSFVDEIVENEISKCLQQYNGHNTDEAVELIYRNSKSRIISGMFSRIGLLMLTNLAVAGLASMAQAPGDKSTSVGYTAFTIVNVTYIAYLLTNMLNFGREKYQQSIRNIVGEGLTERIKGNYKPVPVQS